MAQESTAERPYWSVMIPAYEREFLRETLRSVLSQNPGRERMQIEVVDNGSTRVDVEGIVREVGKGRVDFYRHERNIGAYANWNACLKRAVGRWVHVLHDDDLVYPGFYAAMENAAETEPAIGAAFCRSVYIDEHGARTGVQEQEREKAGVFPDLLRRLAMDNAVRCPAMVVRREMLEELGGFDESIEFTTDWELWMRIAAKVPVWYEPEPLVGYRSHEGSESSRVYRSGLPIRQTLQVLDRWLKLSGDTADARALHRARKEYFAVQGVERMHGALAQGDWWAALRNVEAGLAGSDSTLLLRKVSGAMVAWDHYVATILRAVAARDRVKVDAARENLAQQYVEFEPHELVAVYPEVSKLHWTLVQSGAATSELAEEALQRLASGGDVRDLLVVMLYLTAGRLAPTVSVARVPVWLLGDFLRWVMTGGDAQVTGRVEREIAELVAREENADLWRQALEYVRRARVG